MEDNYKKERHYVSWNEFGEGCYRRFENFISHPILCFYFLIIVIIIGSSGVWLPFITEDICSPSFNIEGTLSIGLATYCIALLSASMADNLLSSENLKTFRFFIFSLFLLAISLAYVTVIKKDGVIGSITCFITLIIWVLNYGNDEAKKDNKLSDPNSVVGGPAENELQGDMEGFIQ